MRTFLLTGAQIQNMSEKLNLEDEIPGSVYVGLGRRGREAIDLVACFVPGCDNTDEKKLHLLEKSENTGEVDASGYFTQTKKLKTHCDVCDHDFVLTMEFVYKKVEDEEGNQKDKMFAVVANAYSGDEKEHYGELGRV